MTFDPTTSDSPYSSASQNPYVSADMEHQDQRPFAAGPPKHSGAGIASFAIAIISGIAAVAMFVVAAAVGAGAGGMDPRGTMIVGFLFFGIVGISMFGLGLATAGMFQADRARAFAILGLVFNLMVILAMAALVAVGLVVASQQQ